MDLADIMAELHAIRAETSRAAHTILDAADMLELQIAVLTDADAALRGDMRHTLAVVFGACAFQDLTGQRLRRIEMLLRGLSQTSDPLLNGPAAEGEGLSQAQADDLFDNLASKAG